MHIDVNRRLIQFQICRYITVYDVHNSGIAFRCRFFGLGDNIMYFLIQNGKGICQFYRLSTTGNKSQLRLVENRIAPAFIDFATGFVFLVIKRLHGKTFFDKIIISLMSYQCAWNSSYFSCSTDKIVYHQNFKYRLAVIMRTIFFSNKQCLNTFICYFQREKR